MKTFVLVFVPFGDVYCDHKWGVEFKANIDMETHWYEINILKLNF